MSLPNASIRRPVTTLMAYVGVLIFGLLSLGRLSQELFPAVTYPQLSIVTPYENAAPQEIETLITRPIEEAVGGISGLGKVSSVSREGLSVVVTEFGWNQNMDFASLAVREKIDLIKERLPRDAQEPVVIKYNPFELPVMSISLSSQKRTPVQLRGIAKKWFKDEIEKLYGVASVGISGGAEEEIRVEVDQARLRASGVSIVEVQEAIAAANLNYPGGTIKESFYEYLVRTIGEFKHLDEIRNVPIRRESAGEDEGPFFGEGFGPSPSNRLVLVKDVANIRRTEKEKTSFSRFNGRDNVTLLVQKQAQTNTIQLVNEIYKKLKELKADLPEDIYVDVVYDQSRFIKEALGGVRDAAVQGGVLAFLVLLLFLKDLKNSSLVVLITPLTVLATFTLMYFMGISLNVISLGGIALGVGMLLDNAVVIIENVYRHIAEGRHATLEEAVRKGSEEVMAPMTASTLTTVSVFLPIGFVTGIAGQIFKQLAWVVVVTQVVSAIVAFTLLPMLIVKLGKRSGRQALGGPLGKMLDAAYAPLGKMESFYDRILPAFLQKRIRFLFFIFLVFLLSLWLFLSFDRVLLPKVDQGQFMVKVDLPVGTRVEFTSQVSKKIEEVVRTFEEVQYVSAVVGSTRGESTREILERLQAHQAQVVVKLKSKRRMSTERIVQKIRRYFEEGQGQKPIQPARLGFVLYQSPFKTGEEEAPLVIEVKGPNLEELKRFTLDIKEKLQSVQGIYNVTDSIAEPFPETKILVDKDRAGFYRLSVVTIAQSANIAMKGIVASKFKEEGREVDIRVQLQERDRDDLKKIKALTVHSPLDMEVPLADFVRFEKGKGPSEIRRVSQERTIEIYAKIYARTLKEVSAEVKGILSKIKIPERYDARIAGESQEVQESFRSLQFAFVLSVILVYMIMAAQFESFFQPFIIMFCLPLSLIGVSLALGVSNTPVSVVAILGIILLGGIVVNNGIILIDTINNLRAGGVELLEAVRSAGKTRLRPILMTAFSSAVGLVPLALGIGEGTELQSPMAVVVMGGILVATFLTLVVIPAVYVGLERLKNHAKPS